MALSSSVLQNRLGNIGKGYKAYQDIRGERLFRDVRDRALDVVSPFYGQHTGD